MSQLTISAALFLVVFTLAARPAWQTDTLREVIFNTTSTSQLGE